jgi:hypothetical protein
MKGTWISKTEDQMKGRRQKHTAPISFETLRKRALRRMIPGYVYSEDELAELAVHQPLQGYRYSPDELDQLAKRVCIEGYLYDPDDAECFISRASRRKK